MRYLSLKSILAVWTCVCINTSVSAICMYQQVYEAIDTISKKKPATTKPHFIIPPKYRGKLAIFILAGQSNMEGDGSLEDYTPIDTENRIFVFTNTYKWIAGQEPVRNNRVGPSISFAKHLIEKDTTLAVGIINCARGGTNIGQWQRHLEDDSLYAAMIKMAKAASFQGQIKGLLFFQGENDTEGDSYDHPNEWSNYFRSFVNDVRNDLGIKKLPIVFAQIGNSIPATPLWTKVKEQQGSVSIKNVKMIKTDDLVYQPNNIHYTTAGYLEIGKRFAKAYLKMRK